MTSVWKEVSDYLDDHRQDWSPETQAMIKDLDTILDQLEQPTDDPMYYVSRHGGFTQSVEMAAHDSQKIPIPAPGYVAKQFKRLERQRDREVHLQERLKAQGLDELLDKMEEYGEFVEKKFGSPGMEGLAEFDHDCATMRAEMLGMAKILAIMNFGAEYRTDPEAAIQRIRQMAAAQFEEDES